MLKKKIFAVLASVILLALNVSVVIAAPPSALHIEVLEWIGVGGSEPFVISGAAVTQGKICAAGMVEDLQITSNNPNGPFQKIWATKRFTCGDGSGTFDLDMVVKLDVNTRNTTANWHIVSGTGSYMNLKGNGKLVGTAQIPGATILDVYDGKVK